MSLHDSAQGRLMNDVAPKADTAGAILSIIVGLLSWLGAHLPQLVQVATLVLTVILIARQVRSYLRGQWDAKE